MKPLKIVVKSNSNLNLILVNLSTAEKTIVESKNKITLKKQCLKNILIMIKLPLRHYIKNELNRDKLFIYMYVQTKIKVLILTLLKNSGIRYK